MPPDVPLLTAIVLWALAGIGGVSVVVMPLLIGVLLGCRSMRQ